MMRADKVTLFANRNIRGILKFVLKLNEVKQFQRFQYANYFLRQQTQAFETKYFHFNNLSFGEFSENSQLFQNIQTLI